MRRWVRRGIASSPSAPLRRIVILTLIVQLSLVAGTVGFLMIRTTRESVLRVVDQAQHEIAARVREHLEELLSVPIDINGLNARAFESEAIDPTDVLGLARRFLGQVQVFDTVSSIYFGSTSGGLIDAGREGAGGPLYLIETEGLRRGTFLKHAVDEDGLRGELLQSVPDFDARIRPWYVSAVDQRGPVWSDPYVLFTGQDMVISASQPAYSPDGDLVGVVSTDLFLGQVSAYLRSIEIGKTGHSFLIDRSGGLIACTACDVLSVDPETRQPTRQSIAGSDTTIVRRATEAVLVETGDLSSLETGLTTRFDLEGETQYVDVTAIRDDHGIDWLLVLVIPEMDFIGGLLVMMRVTAALIGLALLVAVLAGLWVARRITRPLEAVAEAARNFETKGWHLPPSRSKIREVRSLSEALDDMAENLHLTLETLRGEIAERQRTERILQESRERLTSYIEHAPVAIFVADALGNYLDVNPEACRLTGYSREELLGMGIPGLLTAESDKEGRAHFGSVSVTGQASGEIALRRKDGSIVWTQIEAVRISEDRHAAFCIDITERKTTEEALRQRQKLEALGTMASGVAHEINNPLNGMLNYAELVGTRTSDSTIREYAGEIAREGQRVARIVHSLLSFAQEEKGRRSPADLRAILGDAITFVRSLIRHGQIRVIEEISSDVPDVPCSRQQIQQALVHLLTNAIEALNVRYPAHDEDKLLRISIRRVKSDGAWWLRTTIEDHGAGIAEENLPRIFDPFYTTKTRDRGTGLGLAISYGIVEEHGGRLTVESAPGEATRFHMDLPVEAPNN